MKPTKEHIESARDMASLSWMPGRLDENAIQGIAQFLAARDAERDARWEAVKFAIEKMNRTKVWKGQGYSYDGAPVIAALANLGAEEKPKPEPKCGECDHLCNCPTQEQARPHYRRLCPFATGPCPSCSKVPR